MPQRGAQVLSAMTFVQNCQCDQLKVDPFTWASRVPSYPQRMLPPNDDDSSPWNTSLQVLTPPIVCVMVIFIIIIIIITIIITIIIIIQH